MPRRLTRALAVQDASQPLDDVLVAVFPSPHSYTGENMVEVHCHGGSAIAAAVQDLAIKAGARLARAGEFTERAVHNGKMDALEAEALAAILEADGAEELESARASRRLVPELRSAAALARGALAVARGSLDYPVELGAEQVGWRADAMQLSTNLRALLSGPPIESAFRDGTAVALLGPPNAGKSSLFNALLAEERALVDAEPGTTRDSQPGALFLGGRRFTLVDTAGLREATGLEARAVARTHEISRTANMLIWVEDISAAPSEPPMPVDLRILAKDDLTPNSARRVDVPPSSNALRVSVLSSRGIAELRERIQALAPNSLAVLSIRQQRLIGEALEALEQMPASADDLAAEHLAQAAQALASLCRIRRRPPRCERDLRSVLCGKIVARAFDILVIGLGHAGAEAALAATRLGARVAAITQVPERACLMSCNPSVGGPGKSQLVREIDALGGAMAEAADETALQVRLLNRSKGPAGRATRLQVDRLAYARAMQRRLAASEPLDIIQGEAAKLKTVGSQARVGGVELDDGSVVEAPAVILTTGTFLAARMHVGSTQKAGGRAGDRASDCLAAQLRELGLETGRFKTGTPPRLSGASIDWSRCEEQCSEPDVRPLSMRTDPGAFPSLPLRSTFVTRTGPRTHAIVMGALGESPLTTGAITGRGPRYCPSLEQKVLSYPERLGHVIYLEPDGRETDEVYPAGLSTSLPAETQLRFLRTIDGLEQVELVQAGYAVEYDYLRPGQLTGWLELKALPGLFVAGQINGSSGYEEAAGQGLVAGVNAVRLMRGLSPGYRAARIRI